MVRVPRAALEDVSEMQLWEGLLVAAMAIAFCHFAFQAIRPAPPAKDDGAVERDRKRALADTVVRSGPWELLEKARPGETFSSLRIDDGLHAFWVARGGGEAVVRRRVLRGCLEGRVGDEPLSGRGVAGYAPLDGGVALFDGSGAVCLTIPENEVTGPEIVRVHEPPPDAPEVAGAPALDVSRATRSHCGGFMHAALVAPRGSAVVAVDLTSGKEATVYAGDEPVAAAAVSEDGTGLVLFVGDRVLCAALDADRRATGDAAELLRADAPLVGAPVFRGGRVFVATARGVHDLAWDGRGDGALRYAAPAGDTVAAFALSASGALFVAAGAKTVHPLPEPAPAAVRELAVSPGGDLYCLADHGCLFKYAEAAK